MLSSIPLLFLYYFFEFIMSLVRPDNFKDYHNQQSTVVFSLFQLQSHHQLFCCITCNGRHVSGIMCDDLQRFCRIIW
jgi:hypothetical protein